MYESIKDAMATDQGKDLYKVIEAGMKVGWELTSQHIKSKMDMTPCYIGSNLHIERMVWMILNNGYKQTRK